VPVFPCGLGGSLTFLPADALAPGVRRFLRNGEEMKNAVILVLVWACGFLTVDDIRARNKASLQEACAKYWEEEAESAKSWVEIVETEAEQMVSRAKMERRVEDGSGQTDP